jgi:hypothetical protein
MVQRAHRRRRSLNTAIVLLMVGQRGEVIVIESGGGKKKRSQKKEKSKRRSWEKLSFGKRTSSEKGRRALVTPPRVGGRLNEIWVPFTKKTGG